MGNDPVNLIDPSGGEPLPFLAINWSSALDRAKSFIPGQRFGQKVTPTQQQLDLLNKKNMRELIMSKWNTSVRELLLNFKGALSAVVPWLEKSKIPYYEGEAYDEWDTITSTLYETMVVNSIRYSECFEIDIPFAKYDFQYKNYQGLNFILCENPTGLNELSIFVSFSVEDGFEMVKICKVNKRNLEALSESKLKASEVKFYLNQDTPVENITIEI